MLDDPESGLTLKGNEFWLAGSYFVRHCPFCGGALPDTSNPIWVPRISEEERAKLKFLTANLNSAEEIIQQLGKPDYDEIGTCGDKPVVRNIEYYSLSENANIEFYLFGDERIECRIMVKCLPPRHVENI